MSGCAFICRRNIPVLSQIFLPTLYNTCIQKWAKYVRRVFFLLPDKTEEIYRNMFQHLVECCTDLQLILNISCLHLDFEHATHNAARAKWPGIDIKGCQFLLSQSWWRKVQSLGLAAEYKNLESDVGNWIQSFFSLSYKCTWIPTMLRTVLRSTYLHVLLTWKKHMNSQITFYRIT